MKKIKKIGLICLVINIFFVVQLFCGNVIALNNTIEKPEIIEISTTEIMPMMASYCYYSGKPTVPAGANLIRSEEGDNTSDTFAQYVNNLGYTKGSWRYKMETYGIYYDIYECHYWYNNSYPNVFFHH